jgi:hypothetical protein
MSIDMVEPDDTTRDDASEESLLGGDDGDDTNLTFDGDGDPFGTDEDDLETSTLSLFEGDEGRLSLDQRRTMVALMKNRYISAAQHPHEWRTLLADPVTFKSRLNDMFLDLHLDRHNGVAHKRQAVPEGGGRFPTLLHDLAHTREETILLVFLRHRYQSELNAGQDVVFVDRDDLVEHVTGFRPAHATDRSGDERKVANAIDALVKAKILLKTTDEARLRVSEVLPVLLPLPRLHELWEWLMAQNGTGPAGAELAVVDEPMLDLSADAATGAPAAAGEDPS